MLQLKTGDKDHLLKDQESDILLLLEKAEIGPDIETCNSTILHGFCLIYPKSPYQSRLPA